jgi:putative transposase
MANYRRDFIPGGSYFFTVNLADRRLSLLTNHIALLRALFRSVRARHPFTIDAAVILPDHLHAIWTLPDGDPDFATHWRLIKSAFSRGLPSGERLTASRFAKGERGIWQRRYWEHTLRDDDDFARHFDYIHFNPVKHGLAARVRDWPYSSFHRWAGSALIPKTGRASLPARRPASAKDDGFRSAQPILRLLIDNPRRIIPLPIKALFRWRNLGLEVIGAAARHRITPS